MNIKEHVFQSSSFVELVNDVVEFMVHTPIKSLPPEEKFKGGGVYALYYRGGFSSYEKIYEKEPELPIYVGKAVLSGWRQGRSSSNANEQALYKRLREHSVSIGKAKNIDAADFLCRFVVLQGQEADLIGTVEAAMTRVYNPLWNSRVDGFGNHDPGKGRHEQAKSEWDVLHPGRVWADRLKGVPTDINKIQEKIAIYNANRTTNFN